MNNKKPTLHPTITCIFFSHLVIFLLLLPSPLILVSAECTSESSETEQVETSHGATKYKAGAICSILIASAIGVLLPILGEKFEMFHPENNVFIIIKAFAAGVILATGFIHVLPDAFESLSSPCLGENPWGKFPFAGFVAMVSAIGTLMVHSLANSYHPNKKAATTKNNAGAGAGADEEENLGHVLRTTTHAPTTHGRFEVTSSDELLLRHRIVSQVLELGIVVHSVIIGISLGASQSTKTIKPLVAALTFHQFFEGMGLGGCITQANFNSRAVTIMILFFSITTPLGIGIGMGISNVYDESTPTALIVEGILNAASAGILTYMALVDLLAADFMNPRMQSNLKLQLGANLSLLFGSGCMSLLANWA